MCDPVTGGILALQGLGTLTAAKGAKRQAQADKQALEHQATVDKYKAGMLDWRAGDAEARGAQDTFKSRLRQGDVSATQRATFASRGVALDEGSPLAILQDTKYMGDLDAATIHDNAANEAWALREEARVTRENAGYMGDRAAQISPNRDFGNTLLPAPARSRRVGTG
jgi:hypothetical protein